MSKSLGNLITIKQALEKYSPDAIRTFVLSSHYRSPLSYSEEGLEAAERGSDRLRQAAQGEAKEAKAGERVDVEPYHQRFIEAMDDDFNTAQALATLFDLAREINRADEAGIDATEAREALRQLADILGLTLKLPERLPLEAEPFIQLLISTRDRLREAKQWQLADEIRAKLEELGVALEDTTKGTVWKRKR
jgi:cysteinyl-tRNA synthetase